MKRRTVIAGLGGAVAWPIVAQAQQGERMRRVGVLMAGLETDQEQINRLAAFRKGLQGLGWTPDLNLRIDLRFGVDTDDVRKKANELLELKPEVVLASSPPSLVALQRITRSVPIVFTAVTDPVGLGVVQDLARPGANTTGFYVAEFGFGAKWLELLKEIAPRVRRVIVLTDPDNQTAAAQFATIQAIAPSFHVELRLLGSSDAGAMERGFDNFARSGDGGLIALRLSGVITHRQMIVKLAALHRLPAVYPLRIFVTGGGLASYGPDVVDQYRGAASYVDRILKGEKPADLPVQAPTKYETVINLKTAKALGLDVPPSILARADEVIE